MQREQADFNQWIENSNKFFLKNFSNFMSEDKEKTISDFNEKIKESVNATVKSWEQFLKRENLDKDDDLKEFSEKLSENFSEYFDTIKRYIELFNESNKKCSDDLGSGIESLFEFIRNIYDNEISKIFSFPKLGLGRSYNEKLNQTFDKYLKFQTTIYEFFYLLYIPFEQTIDFIKENMEFSENLSFEDDKIYDKWLALLEKNYMNLFHSEKYNKVLYETVETLSEFRKSRNEVIHDFLKIFGVPVNKDMDDLYKEIYLLKKRVNSLEKTNKGLNEDD